MMAEQPPQIPTQGYYAQSRPPSAGMAIAAMVLGIVALVLFCFWYVSIPAAILAIVLGVVARKRVMEGTGGGRGMATAGMVCGVISIALALLIIILAAAGVAWLSKHPELGQQIQQQIEQQQRQGRPGQPASPPGSPGGAESRGRSQPGGVHALWPEAGSVCTWRA